MVCVKKYGWQPIETAPMDKVVLIREKKGYVPDLVRWRYRQAERMEGKTLYMAIPAGWFRPSGGRTHINNPTEWFDIPS